MIVFFWLNLWICLLVMCAALTERKVRMLPTTYLMIVAAALLPIVIFASLNQLNIASADTFVVMGVNIPPIAVRASATEDPHNIVDVISILYVCVSALLILKTAGKWVTLQCLPVRKTETPDVYTTPHDIPPLTLSWPKRRVVLPQSLLSLSAADRTIIITHERAHLRYNDAELTLILLVIKYIFWINPAMGWLIGGWRDAVEMRADRAVTAGTDLQFRRAYADRLLSIMGNKNGEQALPCPSAALTSNRVRSVKMRLSEIMTEPKASRKSVLDRTVKLMMGATALLVGLTLNAAAGPMKNDVNAKPLKRVPPVMPASCPGLKTDNITAVTKTFEMSGKTVSQRVAKVGGVIVSYDVSRAGVPENIAIIKSVNECFNRPAKEAIAKWRYKAGTPIKGVKNKMTFLLTEDAGGSIADDIREFGQAQ